MRLQNVSQEEKAMKKRILGIFLAASMGAMTLTACGSTQTGDTQSSSSDSGSAKAEKDSSASAETSGDKVTVNLFAAKSLNGVMEEIIKDYNKEHPDVKIQGNYDSSGTLMTQIQEGGSCDVFFSAAQDQMDQLQKDKLVVKGTRKNVVNNQVCVVAAKKSNTKVTGLKTLGKAKSIALADGSVPVGNYTRKAMIAAGMLKKVKDPSKITTKQVSDALGGVKINECANVGAVTSAVSEGSNEVGTVYYSDTYGLKDKLDIVEKVSYKLTGNVIYPIAQIDNQQATPEETKAARSFVKYVTSDSAKKVFQKHYFDTDVD